MTKPGFLHPLKNWCSSWFWHYLNSWIPSCREKDAFGEHQIVLLQCKKTLLHLLWQEDILGKSLLLIHRCGLGLLILFAMLPPNWVVLLKQVFAERKWRNKSSGKSSTPELLLPLTFIDFPRIRFWNANIPQCRRRLNRLSEPFSGKNLLKTRIKTR